MMGTIVTAKEVGQYLKLTGSTIYKLALTGEIPGFKIGKSWRFDMDKIIQLITNSGKTEKESIVKPETKWVDGQ
ncbi:MAG: hypothetical protein A2Y79_06625 [Deltaproteobacteria bacterium RBG_13_43_22]|nr:MAG: hypothetical protein A2Y79_06625 [Deltaproteobacteria bacterium RBG_13_43_22]